eukprot:SAG31_NODE_31157_length_371_cov_0.955882_1_plen_77_part_10
MLTYAHTCILEFGLCRPCLDFVVDVELSNDPLSNLSGCCPRYVIGDKYNSRNFHRGKLGPHVSSQLLVDQAQRPLLV